MIQNGISSLQPERYLAVHGGATVLPALVTASGEHAGVRFLEFFAAQIRNPHTRRAYARAVAEFLAWAGVWAWRRWPPCSRFTWRHGSEPAHQVSPPPLNSNSLPSTLV